MRLGAYELFEKIFNVLVKHAGEFPHEVLMLGSELLGYEPKTKRKKKKR